MHYWGVTLFLSISLYTPGHGTFMDTLIMYGLISPLRRRSDIEFHVCGNKNFFQIIIQNVGLDEYSKWISNEIDDTKEDVMKWLVNELKVVQSKSKKFLNEFFDRYSEKSEVLSALESYLIIGHSSEEGRIKGKRFHTVWLPLYPQLGKYSTELFRYPSIPYMACPFCISLSALGFVKAVIIVRGLKERRRRETNRVQAVLLTFEGTLPGETVTRLMDYINSDEYNKEVKSNRLIRRGANILPAATFTYLLLSFFSGELCAHLQRSDAIFKTQSIIFETAKVAQIRGYKEVTVDKLFHALMQLSNGGHLERLRHLSKELLEKEEVAALEKLYDFIEKRTISDLYVASRSIVKALEKGFGRHFCEDLIRLLRET